MLNKVQRVCLLMSVVLLISLLAILVTGQAFARSAASTASSDQAATSGPLPLSDAQVKAYWTPARLKSAQPKEESPGQRALTPSVPPQGPPASKPPVPPQKQGVSPHANPVPPSQYSTFPYSTVGKVFFTDPKTGINYVCSGSAVNSNNKSVVDTAGHCVIAGSSGNDWYTNWMFCPQYYYGSSPFGCWSARQLWASTTWVNSGSFEDDFGDAVVYANGYGNVVNVVGGAGWAYNYPASQNFSAFGYPQAPPFDGNTMQSCTGTGASYGWDDGSVVAIPCNMTGGSSGGPWFISISGTFGYANGHNDFIVDNPPTHMYSPYYDGDWYSVFNAAQNT